MDLERTRYAKRKKKKINSILNISIAVVLFLIGFLVYQLFFHSSEQVANEESEVDVAEEERLDEHENEEKMEDEEKEQENVLDRTPVDREEEIEEIEEITEPESEMIDEGNDGLWEPIGTVQEEPFYAVYEKDHVNWEEMTRALQVATGLGDDMIIWRLENGGDHQSAVGYVSTYGTQETPFEVRIEWVTNRGWKPVSVNQLSENRFLPNSNEE